MALGEWQVYVVNEVRDWIESLDDATHTRVVQAIDTLADAGPGLGRPLVDTIHGSFCSSPATSPAAGRSGTARPPLAEQRYERYVKERRDEEGNQR